MLSANLPDIDNRDLLAMEEEAREGARQNLLAFTCYRDPKYRVNWHHTIIARLLEGFARGNIRRLILSAPPRSGKSELVSISMPAYILGRNPGAKIIATSHTADMANFFSRKVQRLIMSETYRELFPRTSLKGNPAAHIDGPALDWVQRDSEFDVLGHGDSYKCAGVGGAIAGRGGDFIIVDDPIKNRKDAESKAFREELWEWYLDDLETRDEGGAGILVMSTRWSVDDLTGRLLKSQRVQEAGEDLEDVEDLNGERWTHVNLPAILESEDQRHPDDHRPIGTTLWPWRWAGRRDDLPDEEMERLSLAKMRRRQRVNPYGFAALYQGEPNPRGGEFFKPDRIKPVKAPRSPRVMTIRYWDKAGTQDGGKRTAGVKISLLQDGSYLVEHVHKGQWSALNRENNIRQQAVLDGQGVHIYVEKEPGSGGKESAEATVRNLAGFVVYAEPATGDKETRAEPFAAQVEGNNVEMLEGDWNQEYVDELRSFPRGKFKDQVDASSGAFNKLHQQTPGFF